MTADRESGAASSTAAVPASLASVGRANTIRVVLIEDDDDYREALAGELSDRGCSVQGFADGASFLQSLDAAVDADIVVLDWGLPATSGIDLLPQMRRRGVRLPVVFLTGRTLIKYESLAFDRGATDFIDKARGVDVLVKRLKRAVETARPAAALPPEKSIVIGKLVLEPNISRAHWNGTNVGLTVGEFRLVDLLAMNAGRYATYRALYDRLHYEGFMARRGDKGYRGNVRSCIKRIRTKFCECDPDFDEIENYMSFGYCWREPVRCEMTRHKSASLMA
jgi:two-component system, OmpR family, response regulator ChvI